MRRVRTTLTLEYETGVDDPEDDLLEFDRVAEDAPDVVVDALLARDDVEVTVVSEVVDQ